ncbi:hypothetical protein FOA52_007707 [Chlamydomonas sp. UWO 241]|nr:hypothetical protein FOA52_007707 [Chlamydomonas sp. UWO 241]
MGILGGEAVAGDDGNRDAMVVVLGATAGASLSIAGVAAPVPLNIGQGQMARLLPGASAPVFSAMPGGAALAASEVKVEGFDWSQSATSLVVILGVALALAPTLTLGTLLHTTSESVVASLLEVAVYGYILLQGAGLLGAGSEMLLEILNPGIIGGVVLPLLGAIPDSLIIVNAGLHATPETAQEQVAVGVGTLAGSTMLLLSLAYGGSILVGRCDLDDNGRAKDKTHTRGWDLDSTGVTTDDSVRQGALVMAASVLLYGFVQIPANLGDYNDQSAALAGAAACLFSAVAYCVYSVVSPERQQRRIEAAQKKRFRQYAIKAIALKTSSSKYGGLVDAAGALNPAAVTRLFDEFDTDKNGHMDANELRGFITALNLTGDTSAGGITCENASTDYMLLELDVSKDNIVSKDEFTTVLQKWVSEKLSDGDGSGRFRKLVSQTSAGAEVTALMMMVFTVVCDAPTGSVFDYRRVPGY